MVLSIKVISNVNVLLPKQVRTNMLRQYAIAKNDVLEGFYPGPCLSFEWQVDLLQISPELQNTLAN